MGTHTLQRVPAEVESEAFDFMRFMCVIVSGRGNCDRRFIINNAGLYFNEFNTNV
jgi:hypothetical protein